MGYVRVYIYICIFYINVYISYGNSIGIVSGYLARILSFEPYLHEYVISCNRRLLIIPQHINIIIFVLPAVPRTGTMYYI